MREEDLLRKALEEIKGLKSQPIGDTGLSTGPALLFRRAQEIARDALRKPRSAARERSEHLSPPSSEGEGSRDALLDAEGSAEGGGEDDLRKAGAAMLADYQTSERHHPDYVLVPLAAFEAMRVALAKVETEGL